MTRKRKIEDWHKYALDVNSGDLLACDLVKRACQRYLDDLERQGTEEFPYVFNADKAHRAIRFFENLNHSKGKWRGQRLKLEPWQKFVEANLFGWVHKDTGFRRFNIAYEEIPRKNGKSTRISARSLYLFFADEENAPEVYAAAYSEKQAGIVFEEAKRMVRSCPGLSSRITEYRKSLAIENRDAFIKPITRDAKAEQGLNVHGASIDEYHTHKTDEVYDVLTTATGSRQQSLIGVITTAGSSRKSACYQERIYAIKILERTLENENYFAFIASADKNDDWKDEKTWIKANPNIGVSVTLEYLRKQYAIAKGSLNKQSAFKRYFLNIWEEGGDVWLDMDAWNACSSDTIDEAALIGRKCYGGLDLAKVRDLSAAALLFPPQSHGEKWQALVQFYCPDEDIAERSRRDRVPYSQWRELDWLTATPGNTTDYDFIEHDFKEWASDYDLQEVAFDPWGSSEIVNHLMAEGIEMVEFRQGFASMTAPTAELERLVLSRSLDHGLNPILTWCASNVICSVDPAGNVKPDKKKSEERIDGVVALIMALGLAMAQGEGKQGDTYEHHGLRTI